MFNMYFTVLLIVASLCLLLLNANASPIRTTTVYDALQITPLPLVTEPHPVNFLSLSSELCQDNVRSVGCEPPARLPEKNEPEQQSKDHLVISVMLCADNVRSAGCEPPARLTKRSEPAEATLLCGKHCNIIAGECVCHHLDSEWPRIWRYPSSTIVRRAEDKPTPTPTPTEISAAGHHVGPAFPFIWRGPSRLTGEIEDKPTPTPTPTPTETSPTRYPHDLAWSFILRAPLSLLGKLEGKPTPTPTPTETSSIEHPHDPAWPNILLLPTQNVPKVEDKPASTPTPTPTETSPNGYRPILGIIAVEAAEPHHTVSPRDNEEGLRKCHKGRDCNKWHNTFPPPAQAGVVSNTDISHPTCHKGRDCNKWHNTFPPPAHAGVVSKTEIGHPTLSHRDNEAEPTAPKTSTTTQLPTPSTTMAPCDPINSECPNPYYHHCDPTEHECFWDHLATKEALSPTPTAAVEECPENDRQCQGSFLPAPHHEKGVHKSPEKLCGVNGQECRKNRHFPPTIPPTKTGEEKRDVDIVIPTYASEMTINPICTLPPFLC